MVRADESTKRCTRTHSHLPARNASLCIYAAGQSLSPVFCFISLGVLTAFHMGGKEAAEGWMERTRRFRRPFQTVAYSCIRLIAYVGEKV